MKYYNFLSMSFVALLLTANVLGPKPVIIGSVVIPAGLLIFPLTYLLGSVITEVYGFKASRQVIWFALLCNLFMAFAISIAIKLPYEKSWEYQVQYSEILGISGKLMFVSVLSYFCGEFINAYLVYKLKQKFKKATFILRSLIGNWIGESCETLIFIPLGFYYLPNGILLKMLWFYFIFKISYALIAMPIAVRLTNYLLSTSVRTDSAILAASAISSPDTPSSVNVAPKFSITASK